MDIVAPLAPRIRSREGVTVGMVRPLPGTGYRIRAPAAAG